MVAREFGVVVFGASGFTGQRVLAELAQTAPNVKWAAAGRNETKVAAALREVGLVDTPIVVADCGDSASLDAMCKRAGVVINCTGPFRFYGEPVVKACVENGAHYVDITGEPEFIERMELKYSEGAKSAGVHVVTCCGFDSVPADEGFAYTKQHFGRCTQAESFLTLTVKDGTLAAHATTFECLVHGYSSTKDLKKIREELKSLRPKPVDSVGPKLKVKDFYNDDRVGCFVTKFPGADASVVRRSELYRSAKQQLPQVQYGAYMQIGSWWNAARLGFHQNIITSIIALGDAGKKFAIDHPGLLTAGVFTHEGPSEEQMTNTSFQMTFYAKGYAENAEGGYTGEPNMKVTTRVSGPEPGYIATPIFVVAAAVTILEEEKNMCEPGVHTPSLAFEGTLYRDRIIKRGISFEVLETTHV